jgi:hypothetical protein
MAVTRAAIEAPHRIPPDFTKGFTDVRSINEGDQGEHLGILTAVSLINKCAPALGSLGQRNLLEANSRLCSSSSRPAHLKSGRKPLTHEKWTLSDVSFLQAKTPKRD